jgi:hypothetical protein
MVQKKYKKLHAIKIAGVTQEKDIKRKIRPFIYLICLFS